MQVQKISNNNTTFGAKVNVSGTQFDKKVMSALSEKAKKIGSDNDVVDLQFTKLFSVFDRNGYYTKQDKSNVNNMNIAFSQMFNASFLPGGGGKSVEHASNRLFTLNYDDIWQQQEKAANDYLSRLIAKYSN